MTAPRNRDELEALGAEALFHVLAPDHVLTWEDASSADRELAECAFRAALAAIELHCWIAPNDAPDQMVQGYSYSPRWLRKYLTWARTRSPFLANPEAGDSTNA